MSGKGDKHAEKVAKDKKRKRCWKSWTEELQLLCVRWHYGVNKYQFFSPIKNEDMIMKGIKASAPMSAKFCVHSSDPFRKQMDRTLCVLLEDQAQKGLPFSGAVVPEKPEWS
jgi:hypothetical protein